MVVTAVTAGVGVKVTVAAGVAVAITVEFAGAPIAIRAARGSAAWLG